MQSAVRLMQAVSTTGWYKVGEAENKRLTRRQNRKRSRKANRRVAVSPVRIWTAWRAASCRLSANGPTDRDNLQILVEEVRVGTVVLANVAVFQQANVEFLLDHDCVQIVV